MRHSSAPARAKPVGSVSAAVALGLALFAINIASAQAANCTPPGVVVTTDPAGDQQGAPATGQGYDILSVSIAEPPHQPGKRLLAITLKVSSLSPVPSESYWWVHLFVNKVDYFVSMITPPATATDQTPAFRHGTVANGSFAFSGGLEKGSSYDAAKGTITYIVQNVDMGNPGDGTKIDQVTAEAGNFITAGAVATTQPQDDSTNAKVGSYTLGTDGACGLLPADPPQGQFSGIAPRYQIYVPAPGIGVQTQGEFNIGYNPKTARLMAMSEPVTYRVTQPQHLTPALPESCDATWENVSPTFADAESLDPILITEPTSGRTFISNLTAGATALFAYTDDDGANWIQASAAPPNGSADHETIGAGPYPSGSPFASIAQAAGFDYAVYYCAQSGGAFCQRSDDGGASFGNGVPIYNQLTSRCENTHGHAKVSPDGTVYVPAGDCGPTQGGAVSQDAGLSWSTFSLPQSTPTTSFDPSIGVAKDNTVYFCYVNGDGHPHVAVSKDHAATWTNDYDIGASQGIQNAVFVEAAAGDPDRATCGFLGSTTPGNYGSLAFDGIWYLFIATTYDGGKTWGTVNATPGDAVQGAGGICGAGISCSSSPNDRNLLDFNEVTADETGRVFFGYDDGCVSDACVKDPGHNGDYNANLRIARQSGGRTLFAKFDTTEPAAPKNACLGGRRDSKGAHLTWKIPDNGGTAISGYSIFRGTSDTGPFTKVGSAGPGAMFDDPTADTATADYFYRITALNGVGESVPSNVVDLKLGPDPIIESACKLPGLTVITDPAGDATDMQAAHDILSVHFAEPPDMTGKLVVTMNVGNLSSVPPNTQWIVLINTPQKKQRFVAMTTENGTTAFKAGDVGVVNATAATVTTYTYTDDLDPGSNFKPDGTITLVVPLKLIDSPVAGDTLSGIEGRTRIVTSGSAESAGRAMDDTSVSSYAMTGGVCSDTPGVGGGSAPTPAVRPESRFGGSLGWLSLVPLFGLRALRRRAR